jgi:predicted alpha/beta-fold hydrolase
VRKKKNSFVVQRSDRSVAMRVSIVCVNIFFLLILCTNIEGAKILDRAKSLYNATKAKAKEASRCVTSALGSGQKTKHFRSDLTKALESVKFLLYTKTNETEHILKVNENETVESSSFDKKKPTRMIIHGFRNDRQSPLNRALKFSYLHQFDCQIIIVDWRWTTKTYCYFKAVERIMPVGMVVAEFLDFLFGDDAEQWSKLKIIGHSLGAHVAGGKAFTLHRNFLFIL